MPGRRLVCSMKQPVLGDNRPGRSSYFSAPKPPIFDENGTAQDVSWKLRFPNSKADLWNNMPCGEPVVFGIRHYRPVTLLCLKRCLRLAHRHASQSSTEENAEGHHFHGFLMGTTTNDDDERGIVIDLNRFDPGTVRSGGHKIPSMPLPGDTVIPVIFTKGLPQAQDSTSTFSVQDYQNAFKLLHHQVSTRMSVENTSLFPIRLHCFYSVDGPHDAGINLELRWISPYISNSLRALPIKPVPILPTALAKNLSGPSSLSAMQNSSKSGFISMNQSRKLLLLLDSDPKSRSIPTVGIWVSGVLSVHSPIAWLACVRYLHCSDIYERITADGQFLLVLYSVLSQTPLFFQVKSDDNEKLTFDLLYTKQSVQIFKQPTSESEQVVEFQLQLTPESLPDGAFKENEIFLEALKSVGPFFVPKNKNLEKPEYGDTNEGQNNVIDRGRQPKKGSSIPPSILRKSSGGRRSSGSRGRNSSNAVSFSLDAGDSESEVFTDATPMPLPSPHPSTIHQSPSLVKPPVPELSIIFDENYPAVTLGVQNTRQSSISPTKRKVMSEKVHSNSPGIRSPLKNIENLNPPSRGISPQDHRLGPIKPPFNRYHCHAPPSGTNTMGQYFFPQNGHIPVQRRSHSASDCVRATGGRPLPPFPLRPPPRSIMSHHAAPYSSSSPPMQGYGYSNTLPATVPASHPYPSYPQPRSQLPVRGSSPKYIYPMTHQMNLYHSPVPNAKPSPVTNPIYYPNHPPQVAPVPVFQDEPLTNMLPMSGNPTHPAAEIAAPAPLAQLQHVKEIQNPISQPPVFVAPDSPSWMKQLPPEAYQLLMHQDAQLKMLQAQIQKLLAMQEEKHQKGKTTTTETSTQAEPEAITVDDTKVSMGTNTGMSLCMWNEESGQEEKIHDVLSYHENTTVSTKHCENAVDPVTPSNLSETSAKQDFTSQQHRVPTPNTQNPLRCETHFTDKYPISEFASIYLDEKNLREIASANNEEDSDVRSLASSLRAVDLPSLETSTEQSSFSTPVQNIASDMWNAQDSPVLGESASMCVVPPLNLNRSLQQADEQEDGDEEPKDENFMKNLLTQVRDMLKKADIDGASELSSENSAASTPQRIGKERIKKTKCSKEDRVAKATRKQLRKMGVKFDDDTVNVLSSAVMAGERNKNDEFLYALPEPLIPRLNYVSIFAGGSESETVFRGAYSTELSMHANAIALKYLSNEQLEEIATLSKLGKNTTEEVFSPSISKISGQPASSQALVDSSNSTRPRNPCGAPKSGSSISGTKPSIRDTFEADVRKFGEKHLPGMSLVSPCNMSLATRKYMEKYGLIDGDESTDEEEEHGFTQQENIQRPQALLANGENHSPSTGASQILKGLRLSAGGTLTKSQGKQVEGNNPSRVESFPGFPAPGSGFSELKMNLGDTLDMILPFLDDLGRHRQQTPSPGTNGTERNGTRSSQTGSSKDRLTSVSERSRPQSGSLLQEGDSTKRILPVQVHRNPQMLRNPTKSRDSSPAEVPSVRQMKKYKDNEVSQVLSPDLLRAVAEGQKLTQAPGGTTQAKYNPPNSHRCSRTTDYEPEEDTLAGTWPRHNFRSRSASEFLQPGCHGSSKKNQDRRRLSSSPRFPVDQPRTSPPSSKGKRIRAIHERQPKPLEDVKEVEWNSENHSQENIRLSSGEEEDEEEEPILTSRVTDAFKEKDELSKNKSEEQSGRENAPHFLQHLQTNEKRTENENFLDFEKIRNLPNELS